MPGTLWLDPAGCGYALLSGALAGAAVLGEPLSLRLGLGSVAILGGIGLVLRRGRGAPVEGNMPLS